MNNNKSYSAVSVVGVVRQQKVSSSDFRRIAAAAINDVRAFAPPDLFTELLQPLIMARLNDEFPDERAADATKKAAKKAKAAQRGDGNPGKAFL